MSPADAKPMIESSIFTLWQFQFLKRNGDLGQRFVGDYALSLAAKKLVEYDLLDQLITLAAEHQTAKHPSDREEPSE
jgi:hypothetical protein